VKPERTGVVRFSLLAVFAATGVAWAAGAEQPLPFDLTEIGRFDPNVKDMRSLAFDKDGRLYVAGATGVAVFDGQGKAVRSLETPEPAVCATVDAEGTVYVGLRTQVLKFSADGKRIGAWGSKGREPGQFVYIASIAAADSSVYVADAGGRRLERFAVDGDYVSETTGFLIPGGYFDCVADGAGILHVAHTGRNRIERYDANGKLLGYWGELGLSREKFCGCDNPVHIALFGDGRVATTEKGIPRLKVYDPNGTLLAFLGSEAFPPNAEAMALAVDSTDRIALAEPVGGQIRFYRLLPSEGKED